MIRRLIFLPLIYRVRDSAPDGSSPRDCALLLAMEDNLKKSLTLHILVKEIFDMLPMGV